MVRTRRDGGCVHHRTQNSELGVRDSEFLSVVRSTADGLRETCGALWISIPTQMGFSRYTTTFQTMMNDVFREEIAEGWVVIYMDDILVFSKNEKDHEKHIGRILQKLREHKLSLKPEKCWFSKKEIKFLGLIISEDSITMDKGKVEVIRNWLEPKNKKELQQFLGFVNFYRRFVEGFVEIAKPLAKLTGKERWEWTKEQQNTFEGLKVKISEEITLTIPDHNSAQKLMLWILQWEEFFHNIKKMILGDQWHLFQNHLTAQNETTKYMTKKC